MTTPDVSVVVAVYNTMPYLTACLTSLVEQTIGPDRLEILAVDDGSTDGSGRELDRFAERYPDTVRVIHQGNSGGPAQPSNRGLDLARGRYVFFVGADDYLGREALQRLVDAADRDGSDVVLGRLVGVHSRYVHQEIFATSKAGITLFDSALPFALSNTKLFRRDLIERYKLRYPEHMPVLSDQPFTIEACLRASRISVLADYDYYYAVRRLNSRNITYHSRISDRLHCVTTLMAFVADLIEPGPNRDAVLVRHFSWEVAKLIEDDFLRLDRPTQERVHAGVRDLTLRYLTDGIRRRLAVESRLRILVAAQADLDQLLAVIRQDALEGVPATVVEGARWHAAYPGALADSAGLLSDGRAAEAAGDGRAAVSAGDGRAADAARVAPGSEQPSPTAPAWSDVTEVAAGWTAKLDATLAAWASGGRTLTLTARSPRPALANLLDAPIRVTAGSVVGQCTLAAEDGEAAGTIVCTEFSVAELVADAAPLGGRRNVRAEVRLGQDTGTAPLRAPRLARLRPLIRRHGARLYALTVNKDASGHLMIAITPVTARRVMARVRRMWVQRGR